MKKEFIVSILDSKIQENEEHEIVMVCSFMGISMSHFKKSIKFLFLIQISQNFAHLFSIEYKICIIDQLL